VPHREIRVDRARLPGYVGQLKAAAERADGDHLLIMDWGLTALDPDWLTALLEYSQQPAIGAVGAKLTYRDGTIKHIGLLLGVNGVAAPAFHRHPKSTLGYWGTAIAARNYSAVSGACMMTRRDLFEELGGFRDEAGSFFDVDYCLRVADAGRRIVFTPQASLEHADWRPPGAGTAIHEEARRMRARWGDRVVKDPYYNANFSRNTPDYEPELSGVASSDAG
jgi:GT2 family glycosyltransferase